MESVELTLETVTPLFLGGADQLPELRASSVRGALRFWLRAALGSVVGKNGLAQLREMEASVFGQTEVGSPIVVRFRGTLNTAHNFALDIDARGRQLRTGHNYFYYSTRLGANRRVPFQPTKQDLVLTLATRAGTDTATNSLKRAMVSAWLMTQLGGLGSRARRCGGSLQVSKGFCAGLPEFAVSAREPIELRDHLNAGLRKTLSLIGRRQPPPTTFDVLHPDACRVWVLAGAAPWQTWKDAVNGLGEAMQKFRANEGARRNDTNAIFGLPILHGPKHNLQRRASPLWLRVTRLASGKHVGVATLFQSDFAPNHHEVGGGYKHIGAFIKSFPISLKVDF